MSVCTTENEKHENHRKVCIFVSSSDKTKDVFKNVIASYETYWGKCCYRKYAGLNSHDVEITRHFTIIIAKTNGWRRELLEQIRLLPSEVSNILLMLDDFLLLSPVNVERLDLLIDQALINGFNYLRLVPMSAAFIFHLIRLLKNSLGKKDYEEIPETEEYFSSLQPALWKRDHLVSMLELPGTIWEFETKGVPNAKHYAITHAPPIRCIHVVEKGEWMPDALLRFKCLGLPFSPGDRSQRPPIEILLIWFRRFKFAIIGYTGIRIRKILEMRYSKTNSKDCSQ
jgi:hypothetical protein